MAITRLGGANAISGTIPQGNIANSSLGAVTALPAAITTGKVLQVVQDTLTSNFNTTSSTYADTGLTVAITPSSTSNKILILVDMGTSTVSANTNDGNGMRILRDSSAIFEDAWFLYNFSSVALQQNVGSFHYLDTPSSTSSLTYKVQVKCRSNSADINVNSGKAAITLLEIAG